MGMGRYKPNTGTDLFEKSMSSAIAKRALNELYWFTKLESRSVLNVLGIAVDSVEDSDLAATKRTRQSP